MILFGVQFLNYIFPLVMIPFIARVLMPSSFGLVAIGTAYSLNMTLLIEYGFNYSATRDVAANAHDSEVKGRLLGGVTAAKLALSALGAAVSLVVLYAVPAFREHPQVLWGSFM